MKPTDRICPFSQKNCLCIACAIFIEGLHAEDGNCALKKVGLELANIRIIEQKAGGY